MWYINFKEGKHLNNTLKVKEMKKARLKKYFITDFYKQFYL